VCTTAPPAQRPTKGLNRKYLSLFAKRSQFARPQAAAPFVFNVLLGSFCFFCSSPTHSEPAFRFGDDLSRAACRMFEYSVVKERAAGAPSQGRPQSKFRGAFQPAYCASWKVGYLTGSVVSSLVSSQQILRNRVTRAVRLRGFFVFSFLKEG
jgi:hypothetical protein